MKYRARIVFSERNPVYKGIVERSIRGYIMLNYFLFLPGLVRDAGAVLQEDYDALDVWLRELGFRYLFFCIYGWMVGWYFREVAPGVPGIFRSGWPTEDSVAGIFAVSKRFADSRNSCDGFGFGEDETSGRYAEPFPSRNHSGFTFGKRNSIFSINSKLGLLRPLMMCDMVAGCTPRISARREADSFSISINFSNLSRIFGFFTKLNSFTKINKPYFTNVNTYVKEISYMWKYWKRKKTSKRKVFYLI